MRPELVATIRCMSAKLSIGRPSMATIRSPGLRPAAAAALSGWTASTRAAITCLPKDMKMPAKITMDKMKFATGPATTIAARGPTLWCTKLTLRSASLMAAIAA